MFIFQNLGQDFKGGVILLEQQSAKGACFVADLTHLSLQEYMDEGSRKRTIPRASKWRVIV